MTSADYNLPEGVEPSDTESNPAATCPACGRTFDRDNKDDCDELCPRCAYRADGD